MIKMLKITLLMFCSFSLFFCDSQKNNNPIEVDFSNTEEINKSLEKKKKKPIMMAISAMISPKETFVYYKQLVNYISMKLKTQVILKQRKTYQEVNLMLKTNELDAAYICSGAYIDGENDFGLELLVVPVVQNKPYYYAYIIVHKNSSITKFKDLYNKRFAFTDPLSNTGRLYPLFLIGNLGMDSDNFFSKTIYTYGHDKSIYAVARGVVDGASVDSLIFDFLLKHKPEMLADVKIIKKSPPFGIPPFVVNRNLDPLKKNKLKQILLEMHKNKQGNEILRKIMIEKFIITDASIYNSIRNMKDIVKKEIL